MNNTKKHEEFLKKVMLKIQEMYPGSVVMKNNTGVLKSEKGYYVKYGMVGSSDLICCIAPHGRFVGIEIKTGRARQSDQQKKYEKAINKAGGRYFILFDNADIDSQLLQIKRQGE